MAKAKMKNELCGHNDCKKRGMDCNGGMIYFLGVIGAAIHYLQASTGFWNGALGLLKALVWPAMLVYKLLGM